MLRQWIWFFCLVSLGCLGVVLGSWQWQKANDKEHIAQKDQTRQPFVQWQLERKNNPEFSWEDESLWLGKRLSIEGFFDSNFVGFLDNQMIEGQPGLDVLGVLATTNGDHILVNRGWIPWAQRDQLPSIQHPTVKVYLNGTLYPFSRPGLQLGEYPPLKKLPIRLPWADQQQLEQHLDLSLLSAEFRVDSDQPDMYQAHWQLSVMSPAKHRAYAWQWAGLTLLTWGYALWTLFHLKAKTRQASR